MFSLRSMSLASVVLATWLTDIVVVYTDHRCCPEGSTTCGIIPSILIPTIVSLSGDCDQRKVGTRLFVGDRIYQPWSDLLVQ